MPDPQTHPHLPLVSIRNGTRRKLKKGFTPASDPRTLLILSTPALRAIHARGLSQGVGKVLGTNAQLRQSFPHLPAGVPFFLRVDPASISDNAWSGQGVELLAELEDGLIISFSDDAGLQRLFDSISAFDQGSQKKMAAVWEIIAADTNLRRDKLCGSALRGIIDASTTKPNQQVQVSIIIGVSGLRGGDLDRHNEDSDPNGLRRQGRRKERILEWRNEARRRIMALEAFITEQGGRLVAPIDHPYLHDWSKVRLELPQDKANELAKKLGDGLIIAASGSNVSQARRWQLRFPIPDLPPLPGGNAKTSERSRRLEQQKRQAAIDIRTEIIAQATNSIQAELARAGLVDENADISPFLEPDAWEPEPPQEISCVAVLPKSGVDALLAVFPHLIYVEEVPQITQEQTRLDDAAAIPATQPNPPDADAPTVGVIDSGIQENHPLISNAILTTASRSFLPGALADTSDRVTPIGHGTGVAGAVLFPDPNHCNPSPDGRHHCWVINLRVLDHQNKIPSSLSHPLTTWIAVHYGRRYGARVFTQSISAWSSFDPTAHMDPWAAMIDLLCHDEDINIIVPAGNISKDEVESEISSGRTYPAYIRNPPFGMLSPAGAMHAIAVGSIAHEAMAASPWRQISGRDLPSAFTRVGPGWFHEVKPDVVAYGGDLLFNATTQKVDGGQGSGPLLPQSTLYGQGSLGRGHIGTSFAVPQVAAIAATIEAAHPELDAQTIRALLINGARWPNWLEDDPLRHGDGIRLMGYGIPSTERSCSSTDQRVTLIASPDQRRGIGIDQAHSYAIPIPDALRQPGVMVRIDITLSFAGQPRIRRRDYRHYLNIYANWRVAGAQEDLPDFLDRVSPDDPDEDAPGAPQPLPWKVGFQRNQGIRGIRGNGGSIQKDWCVVDGRLLPRQLGIAVIGRKGWERDMEATLPYSLVAAVEPIGASIPIYAKIAQMISVPIQVPVRTRQQIRV